MLPQNKDLKPFANELRKNATPHENRLWYCFLRNYPVRFNRQKIIMSYIADFYCHKARLVVELDGSQHYSDEGISRDAARSEMLASLDLEVLRFSNLDIDRSFADVCEQIDRAVLAKINHPAP